MRSDASVTGTGSTWTAAADTCDDRAVVSIFLASALKP
jgi:hypothetical protein